MKTDNGKPSAETSTVLPENLRAELARRVNATSFRDVVRAVGVGPDVLARLLGGLPVRRGSLIAATAALSTHSSGAQRIRTMKPLAPQRIRAVNSETAGESRDESWFAAWREKHLTVEQRIAFDRELARHTGRK